MSSKNWIQYAIKNRGALHSQLGISQRERIPTTLLRKIVAARSGKTIRNPTSMGKRIIKITPTLEKRANLAINLRKVRRGRRR